jgi:IMP dehydrogenase/GMP reductase
MIRMIAPLLLRRSWGKVPLIVAVADAVIGLVGFVSVGRPGSMEAGGGVGDALPPNEVMNGSVIAARPIAPAMTKRVTKVERAVASVPPMPRDLDRGRWDAESTR